MEPYKIVLAGESNAGKTTLFEALLSGSSVDGHVYNPTIGLAMEKWRPPTWLNLPTKRSLLIVDTAGQERYNSIVSTHYRNAFAVVFCVAYDSPETSRSTIDSAYFEVMNAIDERTHCVYVCITKMDRCEPTSVVVVAGPRLANVISLQGSEGLNNGRTWVDDWIDSRASTIKRVFRTSAYKDRVGVIDTFDQIARDLDEWLASIEASPSTIHRDVETSKYSGIVYLDDRITDDDIGDGDNVSHDSKFHKRSSKSKKPCSGGNGCSLA